MGRALGRVAFARTFPQRRAWGALYSLGTMIVFPTQQTLVARIAPPALLGSYFGFSAISLGVGGAVGSVIGGWLVDAGARLDFPALPWLTLFVVSLLTAVGLRWALRDVPRREDVEGAAT